MSVAEIATDLKVTFPTALYWVKKHGIPIRSSSERTYVKLNPNGDPFRPKENLTPKERELFLLGLVIYWAEGSRKSPCNVQVVNMDPRMLQVFARFLREIACVDESRIRLDVRVYHGFDKEKARRYWCRTLELKPERVFVRPHIDRRSNPHQQWSPYGIATLCVSNTKLKTWMNRQLEKCIGEPANSPGMVREPAVTYMYSRHSLAERRAADPERSEAERMAPSPLGPTIS